MFSPNTYHILNYGFTPARYNVYAPLHRPVFVSTTPYRKVGGPAGARRQSGLGKYKAVKPKRKAQPLKRSFALLSRKRTLVNNHAAQHTSSILLPPRQRPESGGRRRAHVSRYAEPRVKVGEQRLDMCGGRRGRRRAAHVRLDPWISGGGKRRMTVSCRLGLGLGTVLGVQQHRGDVAQRRIGLRLWNGVSK